MNSRYIVAIGMITLAAAVFYVGYAYSGDQVWSTSQNKDMAEVADSLSIAGVHSLLTEGAFEVEIISSDRDIMIVSYDKNAMTNQSKYEDGKLSINFKVQKSDFFDFGSKNSAKITLYTRDIGTLVNRGAGTVFSRDTLTSPSVYLSNEGVGSMDFYVNVKSLLVDNNGVGSLEIVGNADVVQINNDGLGSVNTSEVVARKVVATNAGVGSVEVYASDSLALYNDGVGSIEYSGEAVLYEQSNNGIGSINKK